MRSITLLAVGRLSLCVAINARVLSDKPYEYQGKSALIAPDKDSQPETLLMVVHEVGLKRQ